MTTDRCEFYTGSGKCNCVALHVRLDYKNMDCPYPTWAQASAMCKFHIKRIEEKPKRYRACIEYYGLKEEAEKYIRENLVIKEVEEW